MLLENVARFAADENFPETLLDAIAPHLPFELTPLRKIDTTLTGGVDDWEVLAGLHRLRLDGLVTTDYQMLTLPREMAVLHQTHLTLVTIEEASQNPLIAAGELLAYASFVARTFQSDHAQVFRIPRRRWVAPKRAWDVLGEIASQRGRSIQEIFDEEKARDSELGRR